MSLTFQALHSMITLGFYVAFLRCLICWPFRHITGYTLCLICWPFRHFSCNMLGLTSSEIGLIRKVFPFSPWCVLCILYYHCTTSWPFRQVGPETWIKPPTDASLTLCCRLCLVLAYLLTFQADIVIRGVHIISSFLQVEHWAQTGRRVCQQVIALY